MTLDFLLYMLEQLDVTPNAEVYFRLNGRYDLHCDEICKEFEEDAIIIHLE